MNIEGNIIGLNYQMLRLSWIVPADFLYSDRLLVVTYLAEKFKMAVPFL